MNKKKLRGLVFVGMGFELLGLMLGALYIGQILDEKLESQGIYTAILSFTALIIWVYHLVLLIKKFQNENDRKTDI